VTAEVQSTVKLQRSEQYARDLFEYSPVSPWVEDFSVVKRLMDDVRARNHRFPDFSESASGIRHPLHAGNQVLDVNRQTLQMFGAESKQQLLQNLSKVFRGEMYDSFAEQLIDLWEGKLVQQREVVNYGLAGDVLHIHMEFAIMSSHAEKWGLVLLSLVDITARKKAEAYLEYLGKHDVLTQLRNRAFYTEELNRLSQRALALVHACHRYEWTQGRQRRAWHTAGDAMLRRMGEVLSKAVDAPACAARIGGDEFVVLLPGTDERGAVALQERILSLLELNNQFYPGHSIQVPWAMPVAWKARR
jgi:PAS domain S-box-containing protein